MPGTAIKCAFYAVNDGSVVRELSGEGRRMKRQFLDGINKLKSVVDESGLEGEWSEENGCHQFQAQNGGVLNYWPSTKTINFQGKSPGREELEAVINAWEDGKPSVFDHLD